MERRPWNPVVPIPANSDGLRMQIEDLWISATSVAGNQPVAVMSFAYSEPVPHARTTAEHCKAALGVALGRLRHLAAKVEEELKHYA